VSFFTLPQHWELAREVQAGKPGANALSGGDFEVGGGNFLGDTLPEDKARELRELSSVHYKQESRS
jgi:hypothetical protein